MKLKPIPPRHVMVEPLLREALAADPKRRERLLVVAVAIVRVLAMRPGVSLRKLRVGVRAVLGRCTDGDTDAALDLLGAGVCFDDGPRGAWRLTLEPKCLPAEVLAALGPRKVPS
jgi:hypothetical protein